MPEQLRAMGVQVDAERPLIVYIPCGVGGAPSGITFGLKHAFGDNVHVFFIEPVASPCMLVQLVASPSRPTSVYDIGLDNRTLADGLAVGAASLFASNMSEHLVTGCVTVTDSEMLHWLRLLHATEAMRLEPSAAAAFAGASLVLRADRQQKMTNLLRPGATHVAWTTGGSLVPDAEFQALLDAAC
jgi:D-serine dehydratase